jgi:hypothetical protein
MKHRLRADVEREQAEAGEQEGAQDLVEFERVHRGSVPKAGKISGIGAAAHPLKADT